MRSVTTIIEDIVSEFNVYHFLRLLIIVGAYIFFRQRALDFIKQRQLKNQLAADDKKKAENLIERPEDLLNQQGIEASDRAWGWGKNTRRRVKRQQQLFEEEIEKSALKAQRTSGYDSDEDIQEFLED